MTDEAGTINQPLSVGLKLPPGPIPFLTLYGCWAASIVYSEPNLENDRLDPEDSRKPHIKDCENRGWMLPEKLVGVPIAIHAGVFPFGPGTWSKRAERERLFRRIERAACARVPVEVMRTREIAALVICGPTVEHLYSPWRIESELYVFPFTEVWRLPEALAYSKGAQKIGYVEASADAALRELARTARRVL